MLRAALRVLIRIWFGATVLPIAVTCFVSTLTLDIFRRVKLMKASQTEAYVKILTRWCLKAIHILNPQIKFRNLTVGGETIDIPKGSVVLVNHYSMMEVMYCPLFPHSMMWCVKIVHKAAIRNMPIIGSLFRTAGHLPVYFRTAERTCFSVDKDKQETINRQLEECLRDKTATIVFTPEGMLNTKPETLCPFRYGMFEYCKRYKTPIYAMVHWGAQDIWPFGAMIGGTPGTVTYKFVEINREGKTFDYDTDDVPVICDKVRGEMQQILNDIREIATESPSNLKLCEMEKRKH